MINNGTVSNTIDLVISASKKKTKINKKVINLNIPGKFDYLSLLNNEIKGVRILN